MNVLALFHRSTAAVATLGLLALSAATANAQAPADLFPGETIEQAAGYPALVRFIPGDPAKPLVVFVPGSSHTARIAYGGHDGSRDQDFLAHWLVQQGYNFLGVSYPIAAKRPIHDRAHPEFTIRAWGAQVSALAKSTIQEHKLPNRVILAVWSNGGRIVQSVNEAAAKDGVVIDVGVSLSATPPTVAVYAVPGEAHAAMRRLEDPQTGYSNFSGQYDRWYASVQANARANGHGEIIPRDVYEDRYVGRMPANLNGQGVMYRNGAFAVDGSFFVEDSKAYDTFGYPLMATIVTDHVLDARHALTDASAWAPFSVARLFADHLARAPVERLAPQKWTELLSVVRAVPERLSVGTAGNHFFFVGESGAREAATAIGQLHTRALAVRAELQSLLAP